MVEERAEETDFSGRERGRGRSWVVETAKRGGSWSRRKQEAGHVEVTEEEAGRGGGESRRGRLLYNG